MVQADIIDNKVYCSNRHHNYKIKDYKEVNINGKNHTKFIAECKECGEKFYYGAIITIGKETYFNFDEEAEKEIKENKKEGCINE